MDKIAIVGVKFNGLPGIASGVSAPLTYAHPQTPDYRLLKVDIRSRPGEPIWVYRDIGDPDRIFRTVTLGVLMSTQHLDPGGYAVVEFVYHGFLHSWKIERDSEGEYTFSKVWENASGELEEVPDLDIEDIEGDLWVADNPEQLLAQEFDTLKEPTVEFHVGTKEIQDAFFRKISLKEVFVTSKLLEV